MDKNRFAMTSKQLIFVMIGTQIATGILSLPRLVATEAQQHAWLAILTGVLPSLLSILLIVSLLNRFADTDFANVTHRMFGKFIGNGLILVMVIYIILFEGIVIRLFAEITSIFMLPLTPLWLVILVFTIAMVYAISKGGKVVARLNEFLFYLLLIDLFILLVPVQNGSILNLMPVMEVDIPGVLRGALATAYAYAGAEILLVIYAMVPRREEVLKAALIGQFIVMLIYLMVTVICVLVFGLESIKNIIWPVLTLLKVADIAVLERLELVFLTLLVGLGVRPVMNMGLAASYLTTRAFNLKLYGHYTWVVLAIGAGMYVVAVQPDNILQVFQWAEYAGYAYLVVALGYPLLYHLAAIIRGGSFR